MMEFILSVHHWATPLTLILFGWGVVVLVYRGQCAWRDKRAWKQFRGRMVPVRAGDSSEWPGELELVRRQLAHGAVGGSLDFDVAARSALARFSSDASVVKPISAALIVLALLATFGGFKEATTDLVKVLSTEALKPEDLTQITVQLRKALTAMGSAFGMNILGIFLAALLSLLLPLVRWVQRDAIRELRKAIEEVVRPSLPAAPTWTDQLAQKLEQFMDSQSSVLETRLSVQTRKVVDAVEVLAVSIKDLQGSLAPALTQALVSTRDLLLKEQSSRLDQQYSVLNRISAQYEQLATVFAAQGTRLDAAVKLVEKSTEAASRAASASADAQERFATSMAGSLSHWDKTVEKIEATLSAQVASFGTSTRKILEDWKSAVDEDRVLRKGTNADLSQRVADLSAILQELTRSFASSAEQAAASIASSRADHVQEIAMFGESISQLKENHRALVQALKTRQDKMTALADEVAKVARSFDKEAIRLLEKAGDMQARAEATLDTTSRTLDAVKEQSASLSASSARMADGVQLLSAQFSAVADAVKYLGSSPSRENQVRSRSIPVSGDLFPAGDVSAPPQLEGPAGKDDAESVGN